jgi:protein SCO1/2
VTLLRLVALALLLALAGCDKSGTPSFQSTDVTGADFGRSLALAGHDGRARTLADFRGKVLVVFFGFTHCPDVCPTALARFAQVVKALGDDGRRVQVVMVTVDPERDTAERLGTYVTAFHPTFLGLTGDAAAIARTAREFRVIVQKQPGATLETYTVDHSSGSFVFDPEGRLRLFVSAQQEGAGFEKDIRQLLDGR